MRRETAQIELYSLPKIGISSIQIPDEHKGVGEVAFVWGVQQGYLHSEAKPEEVFITLATSDAYKAGYKVGRSLRRQSEQERFNG